MTTTVKEKIIEAIRQTDDERILFAIKRLLLIEEEVIPEWQKQEVDRRNEHIDTGAEEIYNRDNIKGEISNPD